MEPSAPAEAISEPEGSNRTSKMESSNFDLCAEISLIQRNMRRSQSRTDESAPPVTSKLRSSSKSKHVTGEE